LAQAGPKIYEQAGTPLKLAFSINQVLAMAGASPNRVRFILCWMTAAGALELGSKRSQLHGSAQKSVQCLKPENPTFSEFIYLHQRTYVVGSAEYERRQAVFENSVAEVNHLNCLHGWSSKVNHLADWMPEEKKALHGYRQKSSLHKNLAVSRTPSSLRATVRTVDFHAKTLYPSSVSWGNLTSIIEPRDQGMCGSCWAFAAETTMRTHSEILGGSTQFSVAQLVACVPNPQHCGGSGGCNGATAELAFDYVMKHGLTTENKMPYPSETCPPEMEETEPNTTHSFLDEHSVERHVSKSSAVKGPSIGMSGWVKFPENKAMVMMRTVAQYGPAVIAIAAGDAMFTYASGIMSESACDGKTVNHAVTLYGWGADDGQDYWLIKNSWGALWGELGNFKLTRGSLASEESNCGWDIKPEDGLGCDGGPSKVWVCGTCGILYDVVMPRFENFEV